MEWARRVQQLGAGELLITSMDADGTKIGFDLRLYQQMDQQVSIPVIASGGCGQVSDFSALFEQTNVDAALAASVFHYGELTIEQVKHQLTLQGVAVR